MSMTFATDVVVSNGNSVQTNKVLAPTTSGGSTYGAGTSGQVLTSNGTGAYWANASGGAPTTLSLTAAAGSWSSATPPTQTLTATGVTSSNTIIVGLADSATSVQLEAAQTASIRCTAQGSGEITLTCYGTEPEVNIPVSVVILG